MPHNNKGHFKHYPEDMYTGNQDNIEVNMKHPNYCHIKCSVKPSMKQGIYHVYMLLQRNGEHGTTIVAATSECAEG